MSDDTTPRLQLPLIQGGQAQKHLMLNAGLMRLESLVQAAALSRTTTAQPASPDDGDSYILPAGASGASWSDLSADAFVRFDSGLWQAVPFPQGAIAYIADEGRFVVFGAPGWGAFEEAIRALARSYAVSALPSSGLTAGTLAYASDGRMFNGAGTPEAAGAGTGGLVCWNGSAWKIAGTNQTVTA